MDIKELLKNGASAEELKKVFAEEYNKAKADIAAEKEAAEAAQKREQNISYARYDLAEALLHYETMLGYQEKYDEEDIQKTVKALEDFENQFATFQENISRLEKLFS